VSSWQAGPEDPTVPIPDPEAVARAIAGAGGHAWHQVRRVRPAAVLWAIILTGAPLTFWLRTSHVLPAGTARALGAAVIGPCIAALIALRCRRIRAEREARQRWLDRSAARITRWTGQAHDRALAECLRRVGQCENDLAHLHESHEMVVSGLAAAYHAAGVPQPPPRLTIVRDPLDTYRQAT
jgi:hypothetical protein